MKIENFIKNSTRAEKINKLTELKTNPQTEDVKLFIQKIQQSL